MLLKISFTGNTITRREKTLDLSLTVATLTHEAYSIHLAWHLKSLKVANRAHKYPVLIFVNGASASYTEHVRKLAAEILHDGFEVHTCEHMLPIAAARDEILNLCITDYIFFTDGDTNVDDDYFFNLDDYRKDPKFSNSFAFVGGIEVADANSWGQLEGILDITAILGGAEGIQKDFFESRFYFSNPQDCNQVIRELHETSDAYCFSPMKSLHSFNMILCTAIARQVGGFDRRFITADDREISAALRSSGIKIHFLPRCVVAHIYKFSLRRILLRKFAHGFWGQRIRIKYWENMTVARRLGVKGYLKYYWSILSPPEPFRSTLRGRAYFLMATTSYEFGRLAASSIRWDPLVNKV